ncbi:MAG TPA: RagB/SusD family nutrient uptake outer membrane protein [Niabella sp.]|nr:RagB/SusD family nutrient uptake outer membrane protein [Niabella sp.]HQX20868.1 RagB/SusD family nutrient uptake outer membrane protein [Niabella sp.]HQX41564.1 RagB/SusD family nutrient uptake outer membrane protein [Niabella sp.]HRB08348.1 RagB/SusD family nutrient uptake outer membrane protein [Niabella sp.]HRB48563.1 RagB/SusD family nutrient uptake outer membrane protein [Niabella sp.]
MKRIIYIVLLISMILPMGCKKFLSVDPPSSLSGNNFWRNKNDVEGYVNGLYSLFRSAVFRSNMTASPGNDEFPYFAWSGDLRGAPIQKNPGASSNRTYFNILSNNDIKSLVGNGSPDFKTLFHILRFTQWDRFFKVIASANIAADVIPGVSDPSLSDSDKKRYIGEAVFVRNLCYFFMVRQWGDVPYYTEPYFTGSLVRENKVDVLKSILADMETAKENLPWTYNNPSHVAVRAMKGSAIVLMMHVNMWLACFDAANKDTYYQNVDKLGEEMDQNNGAYELLPLSRTKEIFKGRTREGLFEIPQNVNYGESFGWSAFSDNVLYAPYKNFRILNSYMSYRTDFMEEIFPRDLADDRKSAWYIKDHLYSGGDKFMMLKFANVFANDQAEDVNPDDNQTVFRLPDAYLLHAEALAELGNDTKARTKLNLVRTRAGAPDITTSGQDLKDDIFFERCREFMGEAQYWYDVVRTKRIINPSYKYGYHCTVGQFNAGAWTWPIDPNSKLNNPGITLNNYWL